LLANTVSNKRKTKGNVLQSFT